MRFPKAWTDQQMDIVIGVILRTGVIISAFVVLLGGVIYLHHFAYNRPLYRVFHGEPSDLRHITGIIRDAMALRGRGIIQFGLLLLIATPWRAGRFQRGGLCLATGPPLRHGDPDRLGNPVIQSDRRAVAAIVAGPAPHFLQIIVW